MPCWGRPSRPPLMSHDCRVASGLSGYVGSEIVVDIALNGTIRQRQEPRAEPGLPSLPATAACSEGEPTTKGFRTPEPTTDAP